jgi:hypothetical protein
MHTAAVNWLATNDTGIVFSASRDGTMRALDALYVLN